MKNLRYLFLVIFLVQAAFLSAQTLTLDQCQELARKNYPLIRQKELLVRSLEFTIANAQSGYLPQVTLFGQASYQSDVTRLPGPGVLIEPLAKDQYKLYAELNQTLYDGGGIKNQNATQSANTLVEQQKIEVELYKIKDRINQIYFGVLLMESQASQARLVQEDIKTSLARTEAAIRNGTAFRSNAEILQAELLRSEQRLVEINASRKAYFDMLGYFINQPLNENSKLETPVIIQLELTSPIKRPELTLYQFQSDLISSQYNASITRNVPKVSLFAQGGYGRPALNLLKNDFDPYYIAGLRFSWALSGFYNSGRDKQMFEVNRSVVDVQKEAFLFNTNLSLKQQSFELVKLQDLLKLDNDIIALRTRIKKTAQSQHENGVISTSDFLRELNAEDAARQNLLIHQVQLLLAQHNYQTTIGN